MSEQSETPRTDAASRGADFYTSDQPEFAVVVPVDFARSLERELSEVTRERDEAKRSDTHTRGVLKTMERDYLDRLSAAERELEALRGKLEPKKLALSFHETYERLAPSFGYVTHEATRIWNPESPNGRLMIAVCAALTLRRNEMSKTTEPHCLSGSIAHPGCAAERYKAKVAELQSQLSAFQADAQRKDEALYRPKPDRLIRAYTPTHYPGSLDNAPPPYINVYESHDAVPSVIVTVRSVANKDGTPGLTSCIEIRQPEFREFLTYAARWLGWIPITEDQWLRYGQQEKGRG